MLISVQLTVSVAQAHGGAEWLARVWSSNSTVLQTQVKAKGEGVFAGTETRTSAPEHRIIALEAISSENAASHPGHDCPRAPDDQETELLAQRDDLLKTQLQQQIFLAIEARIISIFAEKPAPVSRGKNTQRHNTPLASRNT